MSRGTEFGCAVWRQEHVSRPPFEHNRRPNEVDCFENPVKKGGHFSFSGSCRLFIADLN